MPKLNLTYLEMINSLLQNNFETERSNKEPNILNRKESSNNKHSEKDKLINIMSKNQIQIQQHTS